jgi:pimeloyl-ACP methyl ester carboxylesterase/UDP:flavonoid glycosyltransferase YjiC (YdhE family)
VSVTETGTRAREPDEQGFATTPDGLRLHWEVHGADTPTIVFLPPCPISHSRIWKAQVHHLARHHRVVVYDGRGNGNSDAPDPAQMWLNRWWSDDCLTVMDATGAGAAVLVGICSDGVWPSLVIAAEHPERVLGIVAIAPGVPALAPQPPGKAAALAAWDRDVADPQGWEKMNAGYIREHQRDFLEFFFGEMFPERHSEKHLEDAIAYGLDGSAAVLAMDEEDPPSREEVERVCGQVGCPILIMQGDRDNCQPFERGARLAAMTGAEHVTLEGVGHIPNAREPVLVNRLIHDFANRFAERPPRRRTWVRAAAARRRALLLSSPIGLGHAWRDVAIARELRRLVPGLEIEWLAQPPLTTLLAEVGEHVHPASAELAPEAAHVDAEAGEHALHAFQMLRRLDEIFCANFMVFHDVVEQERFDVWIADEAWEVDYFLHEHPELKTAPYVWLTDFVGVVPMAEGGEREAFLAADHNAQMVEHVARHPRVRDRSIFVGDPEDIVPERLGPDLPAIADWAREHFAFSGYITGFDPSEIADREALRAEFGYGPGEKVCVVAAGGSGAGIDLLQRVIAAHPEAKRRIPELRTVVVAGPRIDPGALAHADGLEVQGYVHRLYRQLAACDLGIAHGGLSTTMELAAAGRPFLFFPLQGHFEQNHHVAHRLARHGAGRRMSYATDGPQEIAAAMAEEIGRAPRSRPVETGGAERAAQEIASLLA